MNTIWIVRKHPPYPYGAGWIDAFTIHSTHSNRAEAMNVVNEKMRSQTRTYLYTLGKVVLKEKK